MKNYSVSENVHERHTYDDIVKPLLYLQQRHDTMQDKMSELAMTSGMLGSMLGGEGSEQSRAMYDKFNNLLQAAAEGLSTKGMVDPTVANSLLGLRTEYARNIMPIQAAITKRETEAARQAKMEDNSKFGMVFSRRAANTGLDKYLSGNIEPYSQINLDNVYNMGVTLGAQGSARKIELDEDHVFGGQYWMLKKQTGYPGLKEFLENDGDIGDAIANAKNVLGYNNYSPEDQAKLDNALITGIDAGITNKLEAQLQADYEHKAEVEAANKSDSKSSSKSDDGDIPSYGNYPTFDHTIVNPRTGEEMPFNETLDKAGLRYDPDKRSVVPKTYSIWNEDGTRMSKSQFKNKYKKEIEEDQRKEKMQETPKAPLSAPYYYYGSDKVPSFGLADPDVFYDNQVKASQELYKAAGKDWNTEKFTYTSKGGPNKGQQYKAHNFQSINNYVTDDYIKTGAAAFKVIETNLAPSEAKTALERIISRLNFKGDLNEMKKIEDIKQNGTIVTKTDTVKRSDIDLSAEDADIQFLYSPNRGDGGANSLNRNLIVRYKGEMYAIPLNKLGNSMANELINDTENFYKDNSKEDIASYMSQGLSREEAMFAAFENISQRNKLLVSNLSRRLVNLIGSTQTGHSYDPYASTSSKQIP